MSNHPPAHPIHSFRTVFAVHTGTGAPNSATHVGSKVPAAATHPPRANHPSQVKPCATNTPTVDTCTTPCGLHNPQGCQHWAPLGLHRCRGSLLCPPVHTLCPTPSGHGICVQVVAVIGSQLPWIECKLVALGAVAVVTVDYGKISSNIPRVRMMQWHTLVPPYPLLDLVASPSHCGIPRLPRWLVIQECFQLAPILGSDFLFQPLLHKRLNRRKRGCTPSWITGLERQQMLY